ncbi:related to 2`-hydroxyisoflavone reductase [Fusarium oxysporum]|uniref:Related to 2`-hydroxyisoflavone reductase n=1 Tax=Fusarium oxysporum TaxID=5507 RepID=A0A2H3UBC8_FUSOX|nr:related to 2`-hydroxyisoflavone reductase [Fusarium oxysporum]
MVKVAIAGVGELVQEVIRILLEGGRHEVTALSRKESPGNHPSGLRWCKIDYDNKQQLTQTLRRFDVVLSFILVFSDEAYQAQLNLIDAVVQAGVKRFSPSEWWVSVLDHYPMCGYKVQTRQYLENLNKNGKVLEYCLFTPRIFMDYLSPPEKLSERNLSHSGLFIDFDKCRAVLPEEMDAVVSFTAIDDFTAIVSEALEYKDEWPVIGGISGNKLTISDLLQLGERI